MNRPPKPVMCNIVSLLWWLPQKNHINFRDAEFFLKNTFLKEHFVVKGNEIFFFGIFIILKMKSSNFMNTHYQ